MKPNLDSLTDRYDVFIVDVSGTLHDGLRLYPGVQGFLQSLLKKDKKVALLSNSPSPADVMLQKLEQFGITSNDYTIAYTSGEAARTALRDRKDTFHASLGDSYHLVGLEAHRQIFSGLPYKECDFEHADFLYVSRFFARDEALEIFDDLLKQALQRKMKMICANPDHTIVIGDVLHQCAGALAERYQSMGGAVFFHGKPYPAIYDYIFTQIGNPQKSRVLAIGDGLLTDIKGAQNYGIDTLFLTNGIHKIEQGDLVDLYNQYSVFSTYVADTLAES